MGVTEIRQEIATYEASVEQQKQAFTMRRQQIVDSIKPFVKEQLKSEVENQVRTNSEHTKSLGKDALSEMKKRLNTLLENSDHIVEETFSDNNLWVYVDYEVPPNGDRYGQVFNKIKASRENIQKGINLILGEAGKILIDNKYLVVGSQYRWEHGMPYDYTRAKEGASRLIYGYSLSLPQNVNKLIDEYCNEVSELNKTMSKLLDLQKELSEQEAADLWNDV